MCFQVNRVTAVNRNVHEYNVMSRIEAEVGRPGHVFEKLIEMCV